MLGVLDLMGVEIQNRGDRGRQNKETTNAQTCDDMWMNMFYAETSCDTLSHAVHVNKGEMCANVRENTRCEGVLFTPLKIRVSVCRQESRQIIPWGPRILTDRLGTWGNPELLAELLAVSESRNSLASFSEFTSS